MVEMNSPMPIVDIRYSPDPSSSNPRLPWIGTLNQLIPIKVTTSTSMKLINTNGRVLPRISSNDRIGVTINCSMVPISRSRTIAMAVSSSEISSTTTAITPGTL